MTPPNKWATADHLTAYLASRVDKFSKHAEAQDLQDRMQALRNPLIRIAAPTPPASSCGEGQSSSTSGFLGLPQELMLQVTRSLPPSSAAALGLTCRTLYHKINYTLHDISVSHNHLASQVDAAAILHREQNRGTALLDKDLRRRLYEREVGSEVQLTRLSCSVCIDTHPLGHFSQAQRTSPPHHRACLAAEATMYICPQLSFDLDQLRAIRKRLLLAPGSEIQLQEIHGDCQCSEYDSSDTPEAAWFDILGYELYLNQTYRLTTVTKPQVSRLEFANAQKKLSGMLCNHTPLSGIEVLASFKGVKPHFSIKDYGKGHCSSCKTSWLFSFVYYPGNGTYTLEVMVRRTIGDVQMAWDKDYLKMLKGSGQLVEICGRDEYDLKHNVYNRKLRLRASVETW